MRLRTRRRIAGAAGGTLLLLLLGCGGGPAQVGAAGPVFTATTAAPPTTPPEPSEASEPSGQDRSVLAFELPPGAGYRPAGGRVTDNGTLIRQWRLNLDGTGLFCVVIAGEQPNYRGSFPANALAAFRANRDPGGSIQFNQAVDPIPGTVAGVSQRSSYLFSLDAEHSATGVLMIRQYLTGDGILISLNAAGPTEDAQRCQLETIVESLKVSPTRESSEQTSQPTRKVGE